MEDRKTTAVSFRLGGAVSCLGLCTTGLLLLGFLTSKANSITCYKCNSQFDPNCGDPFSEFSIGTVNCSLVPIPEHLPPNSEAKLCRKVTQKIEGKVRVSRTCGYITDEDRDDKTCARRTGTHEVQLLYCSCTGDLCNSATTLVSTTTALSVLILPLLHNLL